MQVQEFLERSARDRPDRTALVCDARAWTYRELDTSANRLARMLLADGLARCDRVAICLENGAAAVLAIFAALKADGVFVVINPQVKSEKLSSVLTDCRAAALITDRPRLASLFPLWPRLADLRIAYATGADAPPAAAPPVIRSLEAVLTAGDAGDSLPERRGIDIDLAALIYTSGSTGRPKGVMLTHLNMVSAATSINAYLHHTADDVIASALPLAHGYGLYQVLTAFQAGGAVVLERSFCFPQRVVERIARHHATGFPLVPTMATLLLTLDLRRHDLSRLRYITNAAAELPPSRLEALRRALPHVQIYSMYGLTECQRVSYLPPDQLDARPGSVGRGMPNEEVHVVDEDGRRLGPNVVGELVVRGSHVMKGYWEQPEETARALRPGRLPDEKVLYTGDMFRIDDAGYLFFAGRRDDIIKSRGERISPREIEEVIAGLDEVAEVVVTGVPDDLLGQRIKATVQLKPGRVLHEQDVRGHCARHLEPSLVPASVEFRQELPRTMNGKIVRRTSLEVS